MSDYELLMAIIGSGTQYADVTKLAREVQKLLKEKGSELAYEDLLNVKSLGPAKATNIMAGFELWRRQFEVSERPIIDSPEKAVEQLADIRDKKQEYFVCLTLDGANRLIAKVDVVETSLAQEHGLQPQHFAKDFEWDVNVLQSDEANAFCLPGGKMAVYTGLIPVAQNADALAVVMGHEIAHALLRHGAQRMAQQKLTQIGQKAGAASGMDVQQQQMMMSAMGYGYLLPYARSHETQADEVGLMLAAAACFNPEEAVPLWQRMSQASGGQAPPEFASTHPNPGTRIQNLQALMPKALEYKQRFCSAGTAAR